MARIVSNQIADIHREIAQFFGEVPTWVTEMPDSVLPGFWSLMKNFQLSDTTAIPCKYKELIGLAVAGATRCKYCTLFHTEAARLNGATEDEIAEASAMGAATMMASTFVNAQQIDYDNFKDELLRSIEYVKRQHQLGSGVPRDTSNLQVNAVNRPSAARH